MIFANAAINAEAKPKKHCTIVVGAVIIKDVPDRPWSWATRGNRNPQLRKVSRL